MAYQYEDCIFEKKDHIATFTLNRPDRRNSFGGKVGEGLRNAIQEVASDDDIWVFVLTGSEEGRAFCSGFDFKEEAETIKRRAAGEVRRSPLDRYRGARSRGEPFGLTELMKPTIAAINGFAMGMGADLALACDIRIASERAVFSEMYVYRGLVPDLGGFWFLPRLVGLEKACELIFTADRIDAEEMLRIRLVSKVVPHDQLMPATYELAAKIVKNPPIAVQLSKDIIYKGLTMNLADSMRYLQGLASAVTYTTEDYRESWTAAAEKREPVFKGK